MDQKKKTLFFLPVYNQEHELPLVLAELKATDLPCDEILFINNGSTDNSRHLLEQSGYRFLEIPENKGIGYSIMLAIKWAIENGFQVFGVMASNGKMLPQEMHRVLEPIFQNQADYVTGSRYMPGGGAPNLPAFRNLAIPLVNIFVRLITGIRITDSTCGYKAFNLTIFEKANFNWQAPWLYTYGFEYYVYCKVLLSKKIRWKEVPITMRYPEKGKPYTKIKPITGWWALLKPWIIGKLDRKGFEI